MTNSTEPNCFVGSMETHLAGSVGDPACAGKAPLYIKHMDKHTDIHTCTYDSSVDRIKDGKIASVKQKPCDLFPTEFFIPQLPMLARLALMGFRKNNKRFPS